MLLENVCNTRTRTPASWHYIPTSLSRDLLVNRSGCNHGNYYKSLLHMITYRRRGIHTINMHNLTGLSVFCAFFLSCHSIETCVQRHLFSLEPMCVLSISLSFSDFKGRMFLSMSSRRDGRLLRKRARLSERCTLAARIPEIYTNHGI